MAEYVVTSDDQTTETALVEYREERGGVQSLAGQMYAAVVRTEAAYAALGEKLEPGGAYAALAGYHAAKQAGLEDGIGALRAKMAELAGLMVQLSAAMPEGQVLFPGVPRE